MDADEIRFRVASATRTAADRAHAALAAPRWRRGDLAGLLVPASRHDSSDLASARSALSRRDWPAAHRAFAAHFSSRPSRFVLDPRSLPDITGRVRAGFPDAAAEARQRAECMLQGRYDILGYRDVAFGTPPAWHADPVHGREAPRRFWSSVPYLDSQYGDHKIIWEINRHQHWLALARAHQLTGDERFYSAFINQLESWLDDNPPLLGVNWASMLELGLRSLSWVWALHLFSPSAANEPASASPWTVDLLVGLDRQLTHVERNLSRYFSPNTHLTGEALALYVAGLALPELRNSSRWASTGRQVLLDEIDHQILADGGHAERSAHYHRYTTDFYLLALLAARATGDPAAHPFEAAARRLANYLRTITDDRGRLPLLGDDDGGQLFPICGREPSDCRDTLAAAAVVLADPTLAVSEAPEEVYWLCSALDDLPGQHEPFHLSSRPSTALSASGYYVSRNTQANSLVFDAGAHGFLNGGHAHADALSMVLTVHGQPFLVDAGTGTYTMDLRLRDRFRSTALHNTVRIDQRSQSTPRGPFHWSSVANAHRSLWITGERFDYVEGYHDGYQPIIHARGVLSIHDAGWIVIDHLLGGGAANSETFWHIHPDWEAAPDPHSVVCRSEAGSLVAVASDTDLEIVSRQGPDGLGSYAPLYGQLTETHCLRSTWSGTLPRTSITALAAQRNVQPDVRVSAAPLTANVPAGWHGAAFHITTPRGVTIVLSAIELTPGASPARGPGELWGCAEAQTDARLAVVNLNAPVRDPIIVAGGVVRCSALASSVHSDEPRALARTDG